MSKELLRRAAPALAATGAALTVVALYDPALLGTATAGSGATASADGGSCATATEMLGDSVGTRFGPVQVAAQVQGSTLCSVSAVVYPDGDPKSAQINAYAIPILDEESTALGAAFDAVSGATYTSEAYRESLQSILDAL